MKYPVLTALVVAAALGSASLEAAAQHHEATGEMAALGVAEYWSESEGSQSRIEFIGSQGNVMAAIDVNAADPSALRAEISLSTDAAQGLSFVWDQVHGTLKLRDPESGQSLESRYDLQKGSWQGDPRIGALGRRYSREIALAALALDATLGAGKTTALTTAEPACAVGSVIPGVGISSILIDCDGFRCRGFGTGGSASGCCEEAWQDASNCCTNGICWGCCRFLACDKGCAIGDYICFCGVTGVECSYPDY